MKEKEEDVLILLDPLQSGLTAPGGGKKLKLLQGAGMLMFQFLMLKG